MGSFVARQGVVPPPNAVALDAEALVRMLAAYAGVSYPRLFFAEIANRIETEGKKLPLIRAIEKRRKQAGLPPNPPGKLFALELGELQKLLLTRQGGSDGPIPFSPARIDWTVLLPSWRFPLNSGRWRDTASKLAAASDSGASRCCGAGRVLRRRGSAPWPDRNDRSAASNVLARHATRGEQCDAVDIARCVGRGLEPAL